MNRIATPTRIADEPAATVGHGVRDRLTVVGGLAALSLDAMAAGRFPIGAR